MHTLELEMIRELQRRGYIIRHQGDASSVLSWNRTEPIPRGIDFEVEALDKIRNQITREHLTFERRGGSVFDPQLMPSVQRAVLRILK